MNSIRYALIGMGMMGHEHLRNLALLRTRNEVMNEVVAVVDPDETMRLSAQALATSLGNQHTEAFAHHSELDLSEIDAVVLVSPNHTHHKILLDLLPSEVAILAEKPICTTTADCEDLLPRLASRRAPFWVAMEYRYMPATARFLQRLREGAVGRLQMLSIREHRYPFLDKVGHWNRFNQNTGGTLVEKCCHHFDLMRLATGSEPVRIFASGNMDVNHLDERYDGRVPDILDNAYVIVDFANGMRASLDLCMFAEGAEPQEELLAVGDEATLEARIPGPDRFWARDQSVPASVTLRRRDQTPPLEEVLKLDPALAAAGDHHGSTYHQHRRFAESILSGAPVEVTAEDGALAVRMGVAAHESLRTGQAVSLVDFTRSNA